MAYKIYEDQITDELTVCPYCYNTWTERKDVYGCCGEVHPAEAYLVDDDQVLLVDEVEVYTRPATEQEIVDKDYEIDEKYDKFKDEEE